MEREFEHRLTETEDRSKSNAKRIDKLEKRQDNLDKIAGAVEVLAVKQENAETDLKEIKKDVKTLTAKPAKRWEDFVSLIISCLVGAVIGYLLVKLGLG